MDKKEILKEIDKLLREHYPDDIDKVILYGSRSRGDAREYSDYDILVVLKNDYDWKFETKINDLLYAIDLKYDILIDPQVISVQELQTIKGKQPFIINAFSEGILA